MAYTRKYRQGRWLTFAEVAELLSVDPNTMFYHSGWQRPASGAFLGNWQVRQLRAACMKAQICEALPNPAYKANNQGGSTND